jgi:putative transposase
MPRRLRVAIGGLVYHVLNRAVGRDRIERNALRADLVESARKWPWGSLAKRALKIPPRWLLPMDDRPVEPPGNWSAYVNHAQTKAELAAIQTCVRRGRPYGDDRWQSRTAVKLGLESTLRPRGRQRIHPIKDSRPAL